jgi:hypothetical protein
MSPSLGRKGSRARERKLRAGFEVHCLHCQSSPQSFLGTALPISDMSLYTREASVRPNDTRLRLLNWRKTWQLQAICPRKPSGGP